MTGNISTLVGTPLARDANWTKLRGEHLEQKWQRLDHTYMYAYHKEVLRPSGHTNVGTPNELPRNTRPHTHTDTKTT